MNVYRKFINSEYDNNKYIFEINNNKSIFSR